MGESAKSYRVKLAIAAVVLTKEMPIQENMAAGLGVAAFITFLGITRTIHLVGAFTPPAIIKGE